MRRLLFWLGWLGFLACAAVLGLQELRAHWARQELTSLARGRALAVDLGCFGCHGPETGGRGVPNPGAAAGKVPSFKSETLMMDVHDQKDIREYIADGFPQSRRQGSGWDQAQAAALKMPAFKDRLSDAQLDDLVAYYSAVNDRWEMPEEVRKGRQLAISLGCFQCHGVDGLGGLANPGSLKGYVPGWLGADFDELVGNDAELREWITKGSIQRFLDNPAAKHFVTAQKVQMPPFESLVQPADLDAIVAYIGWLRGPSGPGAARAATP